MRLLPTKLGAGIVAGALIASAIPAHASSMPCFGEDFMQSARIHDLRINLMVNALKCRTTSPDTLRQYRSLYDQRADEMVYHGKQVEASMIERYGAHQGRVAFDRYETRISNYHSNFLPSRERCDDTEAFIKLAARANHAELETLSKLVTNRAIDACLVPVNEMALGDEVAPAELVARYEAPEVPEQAIAEAPEIVDGIPTYPAGTLDAEPEAEPAAAVVTLAEADPVSDSDDKLTQAINALDAAATALREMQEAGEPPAE